MLQPVNKKGVSIMIGYILLISIVIVISILVYQWMKTYIPKEGLECPDGVSLFMSKISCTSTGSGYWLNITFKNTGKFSVAGYFIKATGSAEEEIATIDLSEKITNKGVGIEFGNGILFATGSSGNSMKPSSTEKTSKFSIDSSVYSVEIIPARFQEVENKQRFVTCGNAKAKEDVNCVTGGGGGACTPSCTTQADCCGIRECETVSNGTCGDVTCLPGCSGVDVCNSTGQCVAPEDCTDTCGSLGYVCGTWTICSEEETCPPGCDEGYECNATGGCEFLCGNGVVDSSAGEECDDGDTDDGDGCNSTCSIETGWQCSGEPSTCIYCDEDGICDSGEDCACSDCEDKLDGCTEGWHCSEGSCTEGIPVWAQSCPNYCVYLEYSSGACTNSEGNCVSGGGVYESGGDTWCTGGAQADTCCCTP